MLGKYNTKIVLPKTKPELARQINSLEQVEIHVLEPVKKENIGLVKSEIETFVRIDKKTRINSLAQAVRSGKEDLIGYQLI